MRAIAGLILGLVAAGVAAIACGVVAVITTFSLPPGINPADTGQVVDAFAAMPAATQVALGVAWSIAGLVGAWVARRIGGASWAAWAATLLIAGYFGFSGWVLPMPIWAKLLWCLGPLIGGFLGNRPGRPAPAETTDDPAAEI